MINSLRKEVLFIEYGTLVKTISGKKIKEDLSDFRVQVPLLDKIKLSLPNECSNNFDIDYVYADDFLTRN